jgi:hypothetical protein
VLVVGDTSLSFPVCVREVVVVVMERGGRGGVGKVSPSSRICAKEVVVWVVWVMHHLRLAFARGGGKWWWWCG